MTSTLNPTRSKFHADAPSIDVTMHPTDLDGILKRPSFGKRALRGLARFLIIFGIGVAATLAWQSYGNAAREIIANSYPQFGWLAPQAAAPEQTAPNMVAPTAAAPYSNVQQLATMLLDLTTVRQSLDQIATRQQQVADAIDKLQATEQNILNKVSAPSPPPSAAPARKP